MRGVARRFSPVVLIPGRDAGPGPCCHRLAGREEPETRLGRGSTWALQLGEKLEQECGLAAGVKCRGKKKKNLSPT